MTIHTVIEGAGKGGKTPKEAPDSLFSNNIAHILDVLSEGEIEGLVGTTDTERKQSIFYNEVPLIGPNGEVNFSGVIVTMNNGLPDQPALPGFDDVRSTVAVSQELPYNIYKTISFPNDGSVTAVSITISASNFFEVEKDGDTVGTTVQFVIERSQNGGSFEPVYNGSIRGKQADEFDIDYRVPISDPTGNTALRVKRTKADSSSLKVNDAIQFKNYTKIVEHKFSYPNLALVGHTLDAKQFGNAIPTRQYRVRGIKCHVPHNYDPVARTYTGPFNGTLTANKLYTNNPVWVFLELITNKRYGLGRFFNKNLIDIPSLYQTAKWCDEPVTDGMGGFEPRWTCNTVINTRGEAFNVLKDLVSCFRGSLFWMQAKLWAFGDQPRSPVKIVTNKNVIGGKFTYSGESNRQRVSVVNVSYNDPDLLMRRSIESVENPDLIREIGYKTKDFGAFGCTSRAQARRLGRAILFAQEFESELISYSAAFDHMAVSGDGPDGIAPGDLILIADKHRGNAVAGGTIRSSAGSALTLDRSCGVGTGTLYVEHKDGSLEWLTCTYEDTTQTVDGEPVILGRVVLTESPVQPVASNDAYILIANGFEAEPFVVLKISRPEKHLVDIAAVRYNEARFANIYDDITVDPTKYMSLPKSDVCQPVSELKVEEAFITGIDFYQRVINISWKKSPDPYLSHNVVSYSKDNNDWKDLPIASGTTAQISDARAGGYRIRVMAVNRVGIYSNPVYFDYDLTAVPDDVTLPVGTISDLVLDGGGDTFVGRDAKFTWKVNTPQSVYAEAAGINDSTATTGIADPLFQACVVTVRRISDGVAVRVENVTDTHYTYTYEKNFEDTGGEPMRSFRIGVQYLDRYGRKSAEVQKQATNPAPALNSRPGAVAAADSIYLVLPGVADTDYAATDVYGSLTTPVPINDGNLRFSGTDSTPNIPSFGVGDHHFVAVPRDVFGPGVPSEEFSAKPIRVLEVLQEIVDTVDPDAIVEGAQDFVTRINESLVAQFNAQLLAEDRKARMESLMHLDGVKLNTRVRREITERIEGDEAIVYRIDVMEAQGQADLAATRAAIAEEARVRASADEAETYQRTLADSTLTTQIGQEIIDREAAIASEALTRVTADQAETQQREIAVSNLYTALGQETTERQAAIVSEQTTRANADEAATHRMDAMVAEYTQQNGDLATATTALIQSEANTRATADQAETSARESAVSQLRNELNGNISAAIDAEARTRADADSAETYTRQSEISRVERQTGENITAAIQAEASTRAGADSAETSQREAAISAVNTAIGQTNAAIISEAQTRANDDGALSSRIDSVSATAGNNTASIQTIQIVQADQAGSIASLSQTVSSRTSSSLELVAVTPGGRAQLRLRSDANGGAGIDLVGDLTIDGNVMLNGTINGVKISNETIGTGNLQANSVTIPQSFNFADAYINSSLYQSGGGYTYNYVGYPNGDYEFNGYDPEYGGSYYNYVGPGNGDYTFAYTSPTFSGGTMVGETDWINLGANGRLGGAFVVLYGTINGSAQYDTAQQHVLLVDRDNGQGWVVAKTNIGGVSTNNGDTKSQIPLTVSTTVSGVSRVRFRLLVGTYNVRGNTPGGSASSVNNVTLTVMGGLR